MHISARLAWHDDGWNGCICRNPAANTFCVGDYSYPGQHIAENRERTPTSCVITYAKEAYTSPLKYHIAVDRVQKIIRFQALYSRGAKPFNWRFTRDNLHSYLKSLELVA